MSSAGLAHRDEEDRNLILKRLLWPQLREASTSDCSSDFLSKAAAARLGRPPTSVARGLHCSSFYGFDLGWRWARSSRSGAGFGSVASETAAL